MNETSQDLKFEVSFFNNELDNSPRHEVLTWDQLVAKLSAFYVRDAKSGPCWSPAIYASGGKRGNAGVQAISVAVFDVDDGTDPEVIMAKLTALGMLFLIHSTFSSTPEKPKYRVVVPLAAPVPVAEWPEVFPRLCALLADGHTDRATKDPARIFFLPSAKPGAKTFLYVGKGRPVSMVDLPAAPAGATCPTQVVSVPLEGGKLPHGQHHRTIVSLAASHASRLGGVTEEVLVQSLKGALTPLLDDLPSHEREIREAARGALAKYGNAPEVAGSSAQPCGSLQEAVSQISQIVKTKSPLGPFVILAGAAQDWIIDLLTSVFYIGFKGRTGSGKGTGVESTILLTRKGIILSSASAPYLNHVFNQGNTAVGFQQADKTIARNEDLKAILLNGYRRGATTGIMVPAPKGRGWEPSNLDIFGFKVFDFPVTIDTHLLSRSIILEMDTDNSVDRALDGEDKAEALAPVRLWMEAQAARVKDQWTQGRVASLRRDPKFRERVKGLRGTHGRDHVIGANLLLISDLFEWNLEQEIREIIGNRRQVEDFSKEERVRTYLEKVWDGSPDFTLTFDGLLEGLNEKQAKGGQDYFSSRGLSAVLQDLGFRKDTEEWERPTSGTHRKVWVIRPHRVLSPTEGIEGNEGTGPTSGRKALALDAPDATDVCDPPLPLSHPVSEEDLLGPGPTRADRALANARREGSLVPNPPPNPYYFPPGGWESRKPPTEEAKVEGVDGVTIKGGEVFYDPPQAPAPSIEEEAAGVEPDPSLVYPSGTLAKREAEPPDNVLYRPPDPSIRVVHESPWEVVGRGAVVIYSDGAVVRRQSGEVLGRFRVAGEGRS